MNTTSLSTKEPNRRYATILKLAAFWQHEGDALWTACHEPEDFPLNEDDYARGEWDDKTFVLDGARYRFAARAAVADYGTPYDTSVAGLKMTMLYKCFRTLEKSDALMLAGEGGYRMSCDSSGGMDEFLALCEKPTQKADELDLPRSFRGDMEHTTAFKLCYNDTLGGEQWYSIPLSAFAGDEPEEDRDKDYADISTRALGITASFPEEFIPIRYLTPSHVNTLFKELKHERRRSLSNFNKRENKGVFESLIGDKFSATAHFVYELLQNADDAEASSISFALYTDGLVIVHNGKKRFTLSDVYLDRTNDDVPPGHINGIVSIGNSTKLAQGNTIGKFGIGFKSVFRYTAAPEVYDDDYRFRIVNYIVPEPLMDDFPAHGEDEVRRPGETLFYLPFSVPKHMKHLPPEKAYEDIAGRLEVLEAPTLFLRHLRRVDYRIFDTPRTQAVAPKIIGYYEVKKEYSQIMPVEPQTQVELLTVIHSENDERKLWKFSRKHQVMNEDKAVDCELSVVFYLTPEGLLAPEERTAYCFFPTKEVTGLNFSIHAPFLLNDSRESILQNSPFNESLINHLAELAAASIPLLARVGVLTDEILDVIPLDEKSVAPCHRKPISFVSFFSKILAVMRGDTPVLPCAPCGKQGYVSLKDAYWAPVMATAQHFPDEVLPALSGHADAHWIFTKVGEHDTKSKYIKDLFKPDKEHHIVSDEKVLSEWITRDFVEMRIRDSLDWLKKTLYTYILGNEKRSTYAWYAPIFLDTERNICAAWVKDKNENENKKGGKCILYTDNPAGLNHVAVILPELLEGELHKLIEAFNLVAADSKAELRDKILPRYDEKEVEVDEAEHLEHFKRAYIHFCNDDLGDGLLDKLRSVHFLRGKSKKDGKHYHRAKELCLDSDYLKAYFPYSETCFVCSETYSPIASNDDKLREFFHKLGVKSKPELSRIPEAPIIFKPVSDIHNLKEKWQQRLTECIPFNSKNEEWKKYKKREWKCDTKKIEGFTELLLHDEPKNADVTSAILRTLFNLYKELSEDRIFREIQSSDCYTLSKGKKSRNLYEVTLGVRAQNKHEVDVVASELTVLLRDVAWVCGDDGEMLKPCQVSRETFLRCCKNAMDGVLPAEPQPETLMEYLEVPLPTGASDLSALPEELRDTVEKAQGILAKMQEAGMTLEEFDDIIRSRKKAKQKPQQQQARAAAAAAEEEGVSPSTRAVPASAIIPKLSEEDKRRQDEAWKERLRRQSDGKTVDVPRRQMVMHQAAETLPPDVEDEVQKLREKLQLEMEQAEAVLRSEHEVHARANDCGTYSFGWFTALLELEGKVGSDKPNRAISIEFAGVERINDKTLRLTRASRDIPSELEDHRDIHLVLYRGREKYGDELVLETVSVSGDHVEGRLKEPAKADSLRFAEVTRAAISLQDPSFLVKELLNGFRRLIDEETGEVFNEKINLVERLPRNIRFVYGPLGTGKTTHLVEQVLMKNKGKRILVLTPTNKAADVLAERLLEKSGNALPCIRFGSTRSDKLKEKGVCRDSMTQPLSQSELDSLPLITTIARLPYDKALFTPLCELQWDMVLMDEASMISLSQAIFALHRLKLRPRPTGESEDGFIIAGDPMQIGPITQVSEWEGQNIYTAVGFSTFMTDPPAYEGKVHRLMTQYRSVPAIGELFSRFAYEGQLTHARQEENGKRLEIAGEAERSFPALTLVHFPMETKREESGIYCSKRLNGSSYHIYSALFAHWLAQYLAHRRKGAGEGLFRIGIISAYRAQANLLESLVLSTPDLPPNTSIQAGTVHGFQGDECEVIIAVFNAPPSPGTQVSLNNTSILNVAISRARDHLFVLTPHIKGTENLLNNLTEVADMENLIRSAPPEERLECSSQEVEKYFMFNNSTYIEQNTYSTAHHPVNLYARPSHLCEVRCTDSAIDIQTRDDASPLLAWCLQREENKQAPDTPDIRP